MLEIKFNMAKFLFASILINPPSPNNCSIVRSSKWSTTILLDLGQRAFAKPRYCRSGKKTKG